MAGLEATARSGDAVGGAGGVIALDARGNAALPFNTLGMYRGVLRSDGTVLVCIYNDEP